jgi:hypothetical protein
MHSVKNRFLLRINNQTAGEALATAVPTLARDLVVLGACLTFERSSLPAFGWLWRNRRRLWAKRREIQAKVGTRKGSPHPVPLPPGEGTLNHPLPPMGGEGRGEGGMS